MSNGGEMAKQPKATKQFELLEKNIQEAKEVAVAIKEKCDILHNRVRNPEKELNDAPEPSSITQKLIIRTRNLISIQRDILATLREVI